ncbi:AP-2 complex subunit alpha [Rhizoctonia solani]|uniref:AP-2 complex subunit alpha n=1 Tax=Rhizoctonia solani TaxID=456999 RepID=A0A8H8SWB1_9AGAM|nr:AP-2 complex subunit alpha [Rhizoctonia solani]QRW19018.1 AP-2 complex subunit alpha [Rhizoctonia solani]
MATNMRGLTQFIADIRASRVRELEEKRINKEMAHIRKKFKGEAIDGGLDGYQKKKYLSKIIFTYILGYKVDIGHMEAVNLISSPKYSEKQIGYLAVTLLMHENSDFLRLVVNSIRKDLDENNEINNCLALHAIANVGGKEMAEALAPDVHRLLISPTSRSFVKKKAALTLLRLYRKHPEVFPAEEWALRIISIMDDDDLGVVVSVTSLVTALAQDHLDAYKVSCQKAIDRLHKIVIDKDYSPEYIYYKVPTPWLQVKLLRLLQYYPPITDPAMRATIDRVLQAILSHNPSDSAKNVQHNNAINAVLFEAISLAIHHDTQSPLVATAAGLLAKFIVSRETNVRYLGLDTMAHLAARAYSLEPLKKHQTTIILSLRDKDISVRRRALDLLYSMCDTDNAALVVGELLKYLKVADYGLREEMVVKIAILTEKYAPSYTWYVDTILQLISAAGDHVGDEVWYRVIQITTNTEDLQEYAAKAVYEYVRMPSCHESLVKVGGYILGEYGHLIANEPGCSPIEQLQALQSKSHFTSPATRALLLSTYVKWANVFPEIKQELLGIFDRYRHVLDSELQQRACEYYVIVSRPDDDVLLQNTQPETWGYRGQAHLGYWRQGVNAEREAARKNTLSAGGDQTNTNNAVSDVMSSLAGLDLSSTDVIKPEVKPTPKLTTSPDIERWYEKLTRAPEGVLYEDVHFKLASNQNTMAILDAWLFTLAINFQDALSVSFAKIPPTTVNPKTQSQQLLHVECKSMFTNPPILNVSYMAGSLQSINLRLPIVLTKFYEGVKLAQAEFFERWKLVGGPPREAQSIFPVHVNSDGSLETERQKKIVSGVGLKILDDIDPNPVNIVAAGVLHMSTAGKVGCLLRLEPNAAAKLCRLTVRSTSEVIAAEMMAMIRAPLDVSGGKTGL